MEQTVPGEGLIQNLGRITEKFRATTSLESLYRKELAEKGSRGPFTGERNPQKGMAQVKRDGRLLIKHNMLWEDDAGEVIRGRWGTETRGPCPEGEGDRVRRKIKGGTRFWKDNSRDTHRVSSKRANPMRRVSVPAVDRKRWGQRISYEKRHRG